MSGEPHAVVRPVRDMEGTQETSLPVMLRDGDMKGLCC